MADTADPPRGKTNNVAFKLDSGCSDHLVSDKSILSSFQALVSPIELKVAMEGQAMTAGTIGKIDAMSNKGVLFNMKNVLFVPDL